MKPDWARTAITALTGGEKKTVKKIADKRITARAPNLTVKSAQTADTAKIVGGNYLRIFAASVG